MTEIEQERPPYRVAALTALVVFAIYLITLAPTVQFWDAPEYMAATHSFGIPHPPGNPLFVLLAHVWGLLPLAADYGKRINLLAAATGAASAGFWFLIGERWLRPIVPTTGPRRLAAIAGALVGATTFTVWNQSVVNEKVYTISLFSITLVLWLAIRWADQPAGARRDNLLIAIAYLLVLTSANHQMGLLVGPAVLALVIATDWRALIRPRVIGAVVLSGLVALTVYLILPIRAQLHPYLNEGNPSTWPALQEVLGRAQYGKPPVWADPRFYVPGRPDNPARSALLMGQQIGNWLEYFTWQWGHDLTQGAEAALAVVFGFLGLMGAWRHWRAERRQAIAMTAMMFTVTLALIFYLNFKNGFSQAPGEQLIREVRERDYFFLVSFSAWGVWVGIGLATLMEWLHDALQERIPASARRWVLATPILLLALIPLATNHLTASRAGETLARDFAHDVLNSVEPYAVIVTGGDNDTFPLWYAQEVDHVRPDVTIIVTSLGNLNWYLEQMEQRPLPTFDAAAAPAMYREHAWPKPTTPWLSEFYLKSGGDTLPEAVLVDKPVTGMLGPLPIALDPRTLPTPGYLSRVDLVIFQIIKEQLGHRPIYFAATTGQYADQLGLSRYLVSEGMVRHLQAAPVVANDSIQMMAAQGRFVNIPRTTRLAFEVYHGASAARHRPRGWVDAASQNTLVPYIVTYDTITEALASKDPALARRASVLARDILANTTYQFQLTPLGSGR